MLRKKKFLIGGLIIVLAIATLGLLGFQRSATYYYTVSEFTSLTNQTGSNVKVNGEVVDGSVQREAGQILKFSISEGGKSLPVAYTGAVPDTFKPGIEVVVEGKLNPTGVFQASEILTKCPSKYAPQS